MSERLEREIRNAERRLEGIVDSAMDAIITIDEGQNIVLFNPAAERMFGMSRAEALGQPISLLIPPRFREGHGDHIRRFREMGVTGRRMGALGAISGLRKDGHEFPIEASISHVDVDGERLATVILRDITERIANEEARLLLAREVDHRAKNALAVVQALVSQTTAPTTEAFIAAVRGRVGALGRAHGLLAQSRWQGGDMTQLIAEQIEPYHMPGRIRSAGERVVLSPNAVQPFSLLIHELATNAVKHGALSLPEGKVQVSWRFEPGGDLLFDWTETGGPPPNLGDKGFGTTLMSTVLRQLGGQIAIDWTGSGIVAHVRLPRVHCRAGATDEPKAALSEPPVRSATKCRVLVVEDEALVGMEIGKALEAEGFEVLGPAGTLEEAFELLSGGAPPTAAVLDINLNGQLVYPVADLLRARTIPYLFCTGYATVADERHGGRPVVHKPANMRLLVDEVHRLCGTGGATPTGRHAA